MVPFDADDNLPHQDTCPLQPYNSFFWAGLADSNTTLSAQQCFACVYANCQGLQNMGAYVSVAIWYYLWSGHKIDSLHAASINTSDHQSYRTCYRPVTFIPSPTRYPLRSRLSLDTSQHTSIWNFCNQTQFIGLSIPTNSWTCVSRPLLQKLHTIQTHHVDGSCHGVYKCS
jgi:hypothetical protein